MTKITTSLPPAMIEVPTLPVPLLHRGKVRNSYRLRGGRRLIVCTDRISALDVVFPNGIPYKGAVLTGLTTFWLQEVLTRVIPSLQSHLVSPLTDDPTDYPAILRPCLSTLAGRSMIVEELDMLRVEAIVRGYVAGSGWKDYQRTGAICNIQLPAGLQQCQKLDQPIFTPSTKADVGHDQNISFAEMVERGLLSSQQADEVCWLSLAVYQAAAAFAEPHGVLVADTKLEWGIRLSDGRLTLGDEVLTPDSSRFWPAGRYEVGRDQPSLDKEPVREWLRQSGWREGAPVPALPESVVAETCERYLTIYERLTGKSLAS